MKGKMKFKRYTPAWWAMVVGRTLIITAGYILFISLI